MFIPFLILFQVQLDAVIIAPGQDFPFGLKAQYISPAGCCKLKVKSIAFSTIDHISRRKPLSLVAR
jgi:hypothetical protein